MSSTWINWITNAIAIALVVLEPIKSYLESQPFNWITFIICILTAIVGYFTGKTKVWEN